MTSDLAGCPALMIRPQLQTGPKQREEGSGRRVGEALETEAADALELLQLRCRGACRRRRSPQQLRELQPPASTGRNLLMLQGT